MNKKYIMPSISVFEVKPAVVMQTASEQVKNQNAEHEALSKGGWGLWSDEDEPEEVDY